MKIRGVFAGNTWPLGMVAGLVILAAHEMHAADLYRLATKKVQKSSEAAEACRELAPKGDWVLADRRTVLEAIAKGESVTTVYIILEQWREKKGSVRHFFFSSDPLPAKLQGDRVVNVKDGFEETHLDLKEIDELRTDLKKVVVVPDEVDFEIRRYNEWVVRKDAKVFGTDEPLPADEVGPEPVISEQARAIIEKKQSFVGQAPYDWIKEHLIPTFEAGIQVVCQKAPAK